MSRSKAAVLAPDSATVVFPASRWEPAVNPQSMCACGIPLLTPSDGQRWLLPTASYEPGDDVHAVLRCGEDPAERRAVRVPLGWMLVGRRVPARTGDPEVIAWERVGTCAAGKSHPVVALSLTVACR